MSVQVVCKCGQKLKMQAKDAGRKFRCPTCGEVGRIPAAAPPAAEPLGQKVLLHVRYAGRSFAWDVGVEILLDEQLVGTGWLGKGVDVSGLTAPGGHALTVRFMNKEAVYPLVVNEPGRYEIALKYSRWTGGFSTKIDIEGPLEGDPAGALPLSLSSAPAGGVAPGEHRHAVRVSWGRLILFSVFLGLILGVFVAGPRSTARDFGGFVSEIAPWVGCSICGGFLALALGRVVGFSFPSSRAAKGAAFAYGTGVALLTWVLLRYVGKMRIAEAVFWSLPWLIVSIVSVLGGVRGSKGQAGGAQTGGGKQETNP